MNVLTRSYDPARTGANLHETKLTPDKVGKNLLVKKFSLNFDDDPRLEAQPLYVAGIQMSDGKVHDVVYVCTMADNVWAFDANDGKPIWAHPTNVGTPIQGSTDIDLHNINILWGILSTPVIDAQTKRMYVAYWTSPDKSVAHAVFELSEIDITSGARLRKQAIDASAPLQAVPGKPVPTFQPSGQKQRASLLLVNGTLFIAFAMTHEESPQTHGWILAYDVGTLQQTAVWCSTPAGAGAGIWQAGSGPAADDNGDIYVMTGNYGVEDGHGNAVAPQPQDFPESLVKLHYTPPAGGAAGKLEPVAWFTPFRDTDRPKNGDDDFQDYDLGSAGPVVLNGLDLVVGAGKDGVVFVLPRDTTAFGQGSDYHRLKQPPIFYTYFPGFGIDASVVANLNHLFDGKTHHLHCGSVFWNGSNGPMLFDWGENECLRAWKIDASGTITFVAKSTETASPAVAGRGGMPGGILTVSSNGNAPNTGIVWATVPVQDANKDKSEGIVYAFDASRLDPNKNADGTPRLKLLWQAHQIPGHKYTFSKFCPPVVADGKLFVPTYDGRVDVFGLKEKPHGKVPTNANM